MTDALAPVLFLVALLAGIGAGAWWLPRTVTRATVGGLHRDRRRDMPPTVVALVGAAAGIAVGLVAAGKALAFATWHGAGCEPAFIGWAVHVIGYAIYVTVVATAVRFAWAARNAALRRRMLMIPLETASADGTRADAPWPGPHTEHASRAIVILCDGTSNRPDQVDEGVASPTNIYKLSRHLIDDERQTVWYEPGVGSDTSSSADKLRRTQTILNWTGATVFGNVFALLRKLRQVIEAAFGSNIEETIVAGYAQIVRQYRPGDRVYLCGFSRGAYAARCIAGVIARVGLLRPENVAFAPDVVRIYRNRHKQGDPCPIAAHHRHSDPKIEFLGVFDTVASLGVPLWGWWFIPFPIWGGETVTTPAPVCRHVFQALAMDERRSQFVPTLFTPPSGTQTDQTLEQAWFRGNHADIGGGYAHIGLSDITLGWMMDRMVRHGLRLRPGAVASLRPDPLAPVHDELVRKPDWRLLGSWPRWHHVPGAPAAAGVPTLHPSVLHRQDVLERTTGRFDMHTLRPEDKVEFVVEGRREWNRTGLVIEADAIYRLTDLGMSWRDAGADPCGPAGQTAEGFDVRHLLGFRRRMRKEDWMCLVVTVAHPREWKLRERGLGKLLHYLLWRDPPELVDQLAPLGRSLSGVNSSVVFRNRAEAGLLHAFANDWWQTANNNTGAILLQLERLPDGYSGPAWTLKACGTWEKPA